jgi:hypothetical protein
MQCFKTKKNAKKNIMMAQQHNNNYIRLYDCIPNSSAFAIVASLSRLRLQRLSQLKNNLFSGLSFKMFQKNIPANKRVKNKTV